MLRESLNKRPWVPAAAIVVLLVLAGALVASSIFPRGVISNHDAKSFYTVDDGATWFTDSPNLVPPFEHDGKTASRVFVFQGESGKPFAGYLMRYTASAKKKIEADPKVAGQVGPNGVEFKKALSTSAWAAQSSPEGSKAQTVVAADGQKNLSLVNP